MIRSLLILVAFLSAHTMAWDPEPGAAGYVICWSYDVTYWNRAYCADVGDVTQQSTAPFDLLWGIEVRRSSILFIQVAAYDSAGNIGPITGDRPLDSPPPGMCP